MKTKYIVTGKRNLERNFECQDALEQAESPTAILTVVADGVTSCEHADKGAALSCEAIKKIMLNETEYIFNLSKERAAALIVKYVYNTLQKYAESQNEDVNSYSSTLSFVCYNKFDGRVMTFTLGDSLAYLIKDSELLLCGKPRVLGNGQTYSTTTEYAEEAVDINIFPRAHADRYILATDGAWKKFYLGGRLSKQIEIAAAENKIIDYLEKQEHEDDCSIVIMDIPKEDFYGESA